MTQVSVQTVYARGGGGGGSQQTEIADGADVVFTDTGRLHNTTAHFYFNLSSFQYCYKAVLYKQLCLCYSITTAEF